MLECPGAAPRHRGRPRREEVSRTVPFDLVAGFASGLTIAHSARERLAQGSARNRYAAVVVLFASGALMPASLVLYARYPDWSLMYLANPAHLSQWLMVPFVLLLLLAAPALGFWVGHRLIAQGRVSLIRHALMACVAVALLILASGFRRFVTVAYYDDFHHNGVQVPLLRSTLFPQLLIIGFLVSAAFLFCFLRVRRHVRAFDQGPLGEADGAKGSES